MNEHISWLAGYSHTFHQLRLSYFIRHFFLLQRTRNMETRASYIQLVRLLEESRLCICCISLAALKHVLESQSWDWIPVSYVIALSTTSTGVTRRLSWDHCRTQGLGAVFPAQSLQRNDGLGTVGKWQHWLRNISDVEQLQVGHLGLE